MQSRPISQKEFINYARGLGNFCTFGDTHHMLEAVFKALKQGMGKCQGAVEDLLPPSMQPIWEGAVPEGQAEDNIVGMIQSYGSFATRRDAEIALVTFFGTIKEKQAGLVEEWNKAIPDEIKIYWEKSRTIDEVQDAGQCL